MDTQFHFRTVASVAKKKHPIFLDTSFIPKRLIASSLYELLGCENRVNENGITEYLYVHEVQKTGMEVIYYYCLYYGENITTTVILSVAGLYFYYQVRSYIWIVKY